MDRLIVFFSICCVQFVIDIVFAYKNFRSQEICISVLIWHIFHITIPTLTLFMQG